MSTLVGILDPAGHVTLATDRRICRGDTPQHVGSGNEKLFRVRVAGGEYVVGCSGTSRDHQVLQHVCAWPDAPPGGLTVAWAVQTLVPLLRDALEGEGRWAEGQVREGATMLVALGPRLLRLSTDLSVQEPDPTHPYPFATIGSGEDLATGAVVVLTRPDVAARLGAGDGPAFTAMVAREAIRAAGVGDRGTAGEAFVLATRSEDPPGLAEITGAPFPHPLTS